MATETRSSSTEPQGGDAKRQTPLITELSIAGFKSFGSPEQTLELGPLSFVVGANASGKTNLLAALRFLRDSVLQDTEFAVDELGGVAEVRSKIRHPKGELSPLRIGIKMDVGEIPWRASNRQIYQLRHFEYQISVDLESNKGLPGILSESLFAEISGSEENSYTFALRRDKTEIQIDDPTQRGKPREVELTVPEQEATRLALNVGFFSGPGVLIRDVIGGWRFYNINPRLARMPSRETHEMELGPDGENLGVILHRLEQESDGGLDAIVAGLRSVVPGFRDIKTHRRPVEGTWAFQVFEERLRGAINPEAVSDGTIRLLALLTMAAWTRQPSSLIAMEEPENGIHPHLSGYIVEILRVAAEDRQLVVTTHNPSLLDYLEPDEVILCDKIGGLTKLRRASDITDIETYRRRFQLGDLWIQGRLGGAP